MGNWDPTTPVGTEAKSLGDDRIREMKAAVQEALQYEGNFPGPNPTTAPTFIPKLLKDTEGNRPAASTDYPGRLFYNSTKGIFQRVADDGLSWEDLNKNPEKVAIHTPAATSFASVAGVVTLPETGNAFLVTGTEAVTSFSGWTAGVAIVQWASGRNLVHSASLQLRGAIDRKVVANDVSTFLFAADGSCTEIAFYGAGMGIEVGQVIDLPSETTPAGFLACDGASYLRTDYPGLFARIGTAHGAADGTHFNVPNRKGYFARAWDNGAGVDPDAAARTAMATGGNTGDHVGTVQTDDFKAHTHGNVLTGGAATIAAGGAPFASGNTGSTGGNETRPKNITTNYFIKF